MRNRLLDELDVPAYAFAPPERRRTLPRRVVSFVRPASTPAGTRRGTSVARSSRRHVGVGCQNRLMGTQIEQDASSVLGALVEAQKMAEAANVDQIDAAGFGHLLAASS